jgi:hypothetical protein
MNVIEPAATCWICHASADSGEHRIKKSDLVRVYGSGPYVGDSALAHVRDEVLTLIQGPGSARLKYEPSLCHRCNTAGTQPYDRAYDGFMSWLWENELTVLRKRLINFEEVYGSNFEESQRNLFKYLVKSFGCRLCDAGQPVPLDSVELLSKTQFRTALRITFAINEDILLLPESDRIGLIGKGALEALFSKSNPSIVNGYQWHEHVSWFTIFYWYKLAPESGLGPTWIANAQHIYLGSMAPLSSAERAEFLLKVRGRVASLSA